MGIVDIYRKPLLRTVPTSKKKKICAVYDYPEKVDLGKGYGNLKLSNEYLKKQ